MSFAILFGDNLRRWLRLRGLALVVVACLVPPGLTAAWVFTHPDDVAVTAITYDAPPTAGHLVNITAAVRNLQKADVGAFNVSVQVGYFDNSTGTIAFNALKEQHFQVAHLAGGAETLLRMNWTPTPGTYIFRATADVDDRLPELEKLNNVRFVQAYVPFPPLKLNLPPSPPEAGNATRPTADVEVENITWEPGPIYAGKATTFDVTVRNHGPDRAVNATVDLSLHAATPFGYSQANYQSFSATVTLGAGNRTTASFPWPSADFGQYALLATVSSHGYNDPNRTNDVRVQEVFVDHQFIYQEPPPKATAKEFYRTTLRDLDLRLLIPLVALFYGAGVIDDERTNNGLAYVLTRPVPRWQVPLARFAALGVVGTFAILLGIGATYLLLLGLPQQAAGYFYWPLFFATLCLLAYGALFTAIGVAARRPYLVGLAYVLGLETLLLVGQNVLVNGQPLIQDWVGDVSLTNWMVKAFHGWDPNGPIRWLPHGADGLQGFLVVLGVIVAGLAAAAYLMHRKEFEA